MAEISRGSPGPVRHGIIAYSTPVKEVSDVLESGARNGIRRGCFRPLADAYCQSGDQQLVEDYLVTRRASGAVVRPITEGYVGRTFPSFSFFGVIFRQHPIAVLCPQTQDLKCSNVFFVKDGRVDFVATLPDLKFFFSAELGPAPSENAAADAVSTWRAEHRSGGIAG